MTMKSMKGFLRRLVVTLPWLLVVMAIRPVLAADEVSVVSYFLVQQTRLSRTVNELTYRVSVQNSGGTKQQVVGTVVSKSPYITITDPTVSFGNILADATVTSDDTITLRHDRSVSFNEADLGWQFSSQPANVTAAGLLKGEASQLAVDIVQDFDSDDRVNDSEFSTTATGEEIARTKLLIAIRNDLTIGDVNALLSSIGARVTMLFEATPLVLVRIPDPGSVESLAAIVELLRADPRVRYVNIADRASDNQLPATFQTDASSRHDLARIDHHMAIGAHAAWNAKDALAYSRSKSPLLLVDDHFGDGTPDKYFAISNVAESRFGTKKLVSHGYHVLGIIIGTFATDSTDRGDVTGIYPGSLNLIVVDHIVDDKSVLDWPTAEGKMIHAIRDSANNVRAEKKRKVVVNSSNGYQLACTVLPSPSYCSSMALAWIEMVRGTKESGSLEGQFLHVVSAGNIRDPTESANALFNSPYTKAHLANDLLDKQGAPISALTNTIVIEDRTNTSFTSTQDRITANCLGNRSKIGGDLSAIGTNVFSFAGAKVGVKNDFGTSMAAPQVAGLAAYVWALNPDLTPQGVINILKSTASLPADLPTGAQQRCATTSWLDDNVPPAPVVDAYGAVLAADNASALSSGGDKFKAPARLAILDIANSNGTPGSDSKFDKADLKEWVKQIDSGKGLFEYSRYDLNGDGRTGSPTATRLVDVFDLNIDTKISTAPDWVEVTIEGQPWKFDESAVTDRDILCYYAYSGLYTETAKGERKQLLESKLPETSSLVANDDFVSTDQGIPITFNVKENDGSHDDSMSLDKIEFAKLNVLDSSKGTVIDNHDGTITFTPAPAVTGNVFLEYSLRDPCGELSRTARVTVFVIGTQPPSCQPPNITFFAPDQTCIGYWRPDDSGMMATLTFNLGNPDIVSVSGNPQTLPYNYVGPLPPPASYIGTFIAGNVKGSTTVRVLATHPDGTSQYYSDWFITNNW